MKKYWIRHVPCVRGIRDGSLWTYLMNFGKPSMMGIYTWYLEGSEPKVLVDTGYRAETSIAHLGLPTENIQPVEDGLMKIGVRPEDIDIVIVTHLHGDHIELASKFPRAKFIIQKAELDSALHPHPLVAKLGFFQESWLKGVDVEVIEGDKEIIDGVRVMLTPGHTPGGQSVIIETPRGTAIITGFCCTNDNFNPPAEAKGLEVVPPGRHYGDVLQAYDSTLKVKQTGYIVLPVHEPSFIGRDRLP